MTMKAEDILRAIAARHYEGALVREMVLDTDPRDPISNAWNLRKAARYGKTSNHYKEMQASLEGLPIADIIPVGWQPLPRQRRIDGLLYANQKLIAIEVKVSVADFRRETEAKREPWEKITHQFVYATPKGLLDPKELPPHCGLWEVDEFRRVAIAKRAKVNKFPEPAPQQLLVSLMYRNAKRR